MLWLDDLDFDLNGVQNNIYTQYVSAHFIDIEQDVNQIEGTADDVMLPYARVVFTEDSWSTATRNHMVRRASHPGALLMFGRVVVA